MLIQPSPSADTRGPRLPNCRSARCFMPPFSHAGKRRITKAPRSSRRLRCVCTCFRSGDPMIRTTLAFSLPVICWCLACAATVPVADAASAPDEAALRQLNQGYIDSFMHSDVEWYRQHTTDDFICIESDGTIVDKATFLRDTAKGPGVADYQLVEVKIRVIGDTALIHAQGKATRN